MSSGKKKENAMQAKVDAAVGNVSKIDPFEQAIRDQQNAFLAWKNGTGKWAGQSKNVLQAPGMDAALDIYGSAKTQQDQERFGTGAGALASPANGAYQGLIDKQKNLDFYNSRAEGLSNAFGNLEAQNTGTMNNLIDRDFARKQSVAQLQSQQLRDYYNRPKKPSLFDRIMGIATGGAGALGSLGFSPF